MMGVSIYVSLEQEIPGVAPLAVEGKMLAIAQGALDGFALGNGLKTIAEMASFSDDEIEDFFDDDEDMPMNEEQWFAATDGLTTIRAMITQLRADPGLVLHCEEVIIDLQGIEAVLVAAAQAQVRFHFSLDF